MKKIFSNLGVKVSLITILINFILFVIKFIAGIVAHSHAMISDAVHSLSDVISTFVVIIGLVASSKEADNKHPYGHERIESVVAIVLAFMLFLTGLGIGYMGINSMLHGSTLKTPGMLALGAALISIMVKEGMYQYSIRVAKKLNSKSMEADAWHHRSDAISSIGSFIGILGARLGLGILDPLCSVLICILIVKAAIEIFIDSTSQMIDESCDSEVTKNLFDTILATEDNIEINDLKTRIFGSKVYIDTEIAVDGNMKLYAANELANHIHDTIEAKYDFVKHCNIHVVPKK